MLSKPKVQTAGWYQQFNTDSQMVKISFLPARHWSRRGLSDTNRHLWGSFVVEAGGKKIFFSGDTGYGNHFKQVGSLFNGIDICIIGVGAYKPEWFMSPNHISPSDAVKAANEMNAKICIPMHYGTFDLSDEPMGEPEKILLKEKEEARLDAELHLLPVGKNLNY
jgi:L-ascorbate metabolism protein UlaG (beta-lactamase superfamily)